jgi:hypothetical protein
MPALWSEWDEALGHFKRYTRRSLNAAAAGLPFQHLESCYLFPEMLPAAALRRARGTGARGTAFPDLPPRTNRLLYALGSATQSARRLLPFGTSVFAAFERH